MLNAPAIQCGKCKSPLPDALFNQPDFSACPTCGSAVLAEVYPARFRAAPLIQAATPIVTDEEAACFYHSDKKAIVPCDACGRFLCAVCDCEIRGRHLCPGCLESGAKKGRIEKMETKRMLWDQIALALAIYPMLFCYLTLITAPAALFISIRYWKAPGSVVPRSKVRFIIAIVISSLQIISWIVTFGFLIHTAVKP